MRLAGKNLRILDAYKILHRNENQSTVSVGKLNIMGLVPNCMPSLGTATRELKEIKK